MAGKRHRNNLKDTDSNLNYLLNDAINKIKDLKSANFDETVDLAINLGAHASIVAVGIAFAIILLTYLVCFIYKPSIYSSTNDQSIWNLGSGI